MKLDVRDLGGHLNVTYKSWCGTLSARVKAVLSVILLVSALPLDYDGKLRILRANFIPAALHGIEASLLSHSSYIRLKAAFVRACWSSEMSMAHSGTVLSMLDGPEGVDPGFCIDWFRFRLLRRYLAYRLDESARIGRLLELVSGRGGLLDMGPCIFLFEVLLKLGSDGALTVSVGIGLGCLGYPFLMGRLSILSLQLLMPGGTVFLLTSVVGRGFGVILFWIMLDPGS